MLNSAQKSVGNTMFGKSDENVMALNGSDRHRAVSIDETNWGYIVSRGARARRIAGFGEVAAVAACLMFGTFAYAPWVLPVSISNVDVLPYKISATIMFFVFSALLYIMSRRGLSFEVQIDTRRRIVRTARRNRANTVTQIEQFAFSDIKSVHMKRSKSPMAVGQIFLNPTGSNRAVLVASGPARDLEPVLRRMIADMREAAPVRAADSGFGNVAKRPPGAFAA